MRKLNYEECLDFVRRKRGITLYEYQRVILKAFCDGEEIFVPRGGGRTTVAKLFGEYVAYVLDKNKKIDDCEQEISTSLENWKEQSEM